jgi:hypothetical protein
MSRYTRKRLILAKSEGVSYGIDAAPTAAANAILVSEINSAFEPANVDRALIRPYFGNSEQLVGTRSVTLTFNVELVGSGTAGVAPAWGLLLEACGTLGTPEVATRVDYLPITDNIPSLTFYYYRDGTLRKALGCRGTAVVRLNSGEMPVLAFTFRGLDGGLAAAPLPSDADFSDFITPSIPTDANTADLVLGGALSTSGAVAFTGGTAVPSLGIEVNLGNATPLVPLIGAESVDVTDRQVVATVRLDLTAAQEVARQADVLAATLSSVGLIHGTAAGKKVALYLPRAQFTSPTEEDFNGRALMRYELRAVPDAGNDEVRVVASF